MTLPASFKKIILAFGDLAAFAMALAAAILIRYRLAEIDRRLLLLHARPFAVLFFLWIVAFFVYNLYDSRYLKNSPAFAALAAQAFVASGILAVVFFYFNPLVGIEPRTVLFITVAISMIFFGSWRFLFNRFLSERLLQDIAIVRGAAVDDRAVELARLLQKNPNLGYRVRAFVGASPLPPDLASIPQVAKPRDLAHYGHAIQTIVFTGEARPDPETAAAFLDLLSLKASFMALSSFIERATQRVPLSELTESWFLENLSEGEKRFYETIKYIFDVIAAFLMGIFTLPLAALIALGIKLEDGRRIFYRQARVGKGGKIFQIAKFQTMVEGAEKDGPKWTERHDPRVTRFGKFLRETRLDELPQLWNIIRGEMSFVGPRPERPEFVVELRKEIPFYDVRHLVRPGLSGWAQINYPYGSSVRDAYEKLQYDIYYIKNRSIPFDLSVALKTLSIMLRKKGR